MINDEIHAFILKPLSEMNHNISGIDDDTLLGPAGTDLESLELAWLIHQIEQRHGRELDLDDGSLARMATVSGAAELLDELLNELRLEAADG